MRQRTKLGLLAGLYLSQGLPFGFFTQALPVLLRDLGVSLPAIGLTSLLAAPWALKFLWAPLVDRWGPRRRWILALQATAAAVTIAIAFIDPARALWVLLGAVLLTNLVAATQDIATDGLAVDLLTPAERGWGNGIQVAGYRVGMILGGGILLLLFERLGWSLTFLLMSGTLAMASVPILAYREPPRAPRASVSTRAWDLWRQPGLARWGVFLLLYKSGDALAGGMLRPWLVDLGWTMEDIGWLLGVGGFTAGLLGALAGGAGVGLLGRRTSLVLFGALEALVVISWASAATVGASPTAISAICLAEHFIGGMVTAALFTAMMDACRPSHGATDYTVQASAVVLATGTAATISGFGAEALGYAGLFQVSAVISIGATLAATRVPLPSESP